MSGDRSEKLRELDYFNAISCLMVMLIHVLSLGITSLNMSSWQYAVILIPHQLAAYVVPAFLFCGAVKMSLAFRNPSSSKSGYFQYILRRFRKIYLPYAAYTIVYYIIFAHTGRLERTGFSSLIHYLLTGTISAQFYYVIVVMQFYLLMPLWRWVTNRVPWFVGVPLALFLTLLASKGDTVLALFGRSFAYFERVFPTYLVQWVVGLYVGKHYDRVRDALIRRRGWTLSLSFITAVYVFLVYLSRTYQYWLYDFNLMRPYSDLASIAILLCLCIWLERSRLKRPKKLLAAIHSASFSVYLSHPLFLTLSTSYFQRAGITDTGALLLLRFAICFTLPFLLHLLLNQSRSLLRSAVKRTAR